MIAYLKGKLTLKNPTYVILETGGIGYQVFISLNTFAQIQSKDEVLLHTVYHVTDSAHTLYGFYEVSEKELFTHLISVSGVGPSTARLTLSYITPADLRTAIVNENIAVIQSVKGIGAKSAKRIILELKDKLLRDGDAETISIGQGNTTRDEALSALVALGFNKASAEKTIDKVIKSGEKTDTVEQLIKLSLKSL